MALELALVDAGAVDCFVLGAADSGGRRRWVWVTDGVGEIGLQDARHGAASTYAAVWRLEDRTGESLISHAEDVLALLGLIGDTAHDGRCCKLLCVEDGTSGAPVAALIAEVARIVADHAPGSATADTPLVVVGPKGASVPAIAHDGLAHVRARCLAAFRKAGAYGWQIRDTGELAAKAGQGPMAVLAVEPVTLTLADAVAAINVLGAMPAAA